MKPVCAGCQCEFKPVVVGVTVVEYADFGPYKLWQADLYQCPGCGTTIATNYAKQPLAEHWQAGFFDHLEKARVDCKLVHSFPAPATLTR